MKRPGHILLIEDNSLDVELTLDAFRDTRQPNTIHVARSGREALDYLFAQGPYADRRTHPLPNLILLDLKLPGMDGFEVLEQVKASPELRRLPAVVLTSSREEGDRAQAYDRGANSYLVKPVSYQGFVDLVQHIQSYWLVLNEAPPEE